MGWQEKEIGKTRKAVPGFYQLKVAYLKEGSKGTMVTPEKQQIVVQPVANSGL